jgi:putative hydrolase of the HAD superfamily
MSSRSCQQPTNLKAVIFDYGEVLSHSPTTEEMNRLAGFFGVAPDKFVELWERNRGLYDRGDLTPEVYWSMLARDAGSEIPPRNLEEICELDITMWSHVNASMVEWARALRSSGLRLGLLSNMYPDMVTHARKHFDWLSNFDCVIFSAEVRLIKPDPAIYRRTLRGLDVEPSEALFLDDREINVRAARALGINAIRFQSMTQLGSDMQAAGFPILRETLTSASQPRA